MLKQETDLLVDNVKYGKITNLEKDLMIFDWKAAAFQKLSSFRERRSRQAFTRKTV